MSEPNSATDSATLNPKKHGLLRRAVNRVLVTIAALVLIFEQWLWLRLLAMMSAIGRWPGFRWLETRIAALPAWAAIIVFFLPATLLLPVKLAALWLIKSGHAIVGVCIIIGAKLIGTALVARIFALTQPALMTIGWFARAYNWFIPWKDNLIARLKATPTYQAVHAQVQAVKARASSLVKAFKERVFGASPNPTKRGKFARILGKRRARNSQEP